MPAELGKGRPRRSPCTRPESPDRTEGACPRLDLTVTLPAHQDGGSAEARTERVQRYCSVGVLMGVDADNDLGGLLRLMHGGSPLQGVVRGARRCGPQSAMRQPRVRSIASIGSSKRRVRTPYGYPTSPTSRPGPASSTSHWSSTPSRGASSAGASPARLTTASCWMLEQALHERRPIRGGGLVHHSDRGVQGGFKRSSQHPLPGDCDVHSKATLGSIWTAAVVVAGPTADRRPR